MRCFSPSLGSQRYFYQVGTQHFGSHSINICVTNPLKPSGHYMYHHFNIHRFCVLPAQCIYVCVFFLWFWEQTAIILPYSINWVVVRYTCKILKRVLASSYVSVSPRSTTGLPLDWFSWNLIFEGFSKICRHGALREETPVRVWCLAIVFLEWEMFIQICRENQNNFVSVVCFAEMVLFVS